MPRAPGHSSRTSARSGTTGVGNPWLREILIECARAASRSRDTYLKAQYLRLRRRRGDSKAIVAVAHPILVSAYYVLARNEPYTDLGFDHYELRSAGDFKLVVRDHRNTPSLLVRLYCP